MYSQRRRLPIALLLTAALGSARLLSWFQPSQKDLATGSVRGVIVDVSAAIIPNAIVKFVSPVNTNKDYQINCNRDGSFRLDSVSDILPWRSVAVMTHVSTVTT